MYSIKFVILLLMFNQYNVNGFNIFDINSGFDYLNKKLSSMMSTVQKDYVKTLWILQDLDHFDPKNVRKLKMRYFENVKYFKENGPIFIFLGGESPSSPNWARSGMMYELATETRGAMYVTEHRYYGLSKPLRATNADKYKFLSSRQALADVAVLIKSLKLIPMYKKSKIVVIGGSYAGNLAAWMKDLYPDLVDAALASSAPVLAKTDFYEYLEKVTDDYEHYGTEGCVDKIKNKFERYNSLLQTPEGIEQLKKEENICDSCDMSIPENQQFFFEYQANPFMYNSQYGTTEKIKNHCTRLNNYALFLEQYPLTRFVYSENKNCKNFDFNEMIEQLKESDDFYSAWLYQTCTEFGYFQSTTSKTQIFSNIPLQYFVKTCTGVYGKDFNEKFIDNSVERTNKVYGGLKPNVTKVVFSNGAIDPWSTISILEDLSYDAPAVVIARSSHCNDLLPSKDNDLEELKEARKHIKYLIKKWIGVGEYINS